MALQITWLALLGLMLGGYFVLGGYDYGVQALRPFLARGEEDRGAALGALGPFFLGNEVWLVAFAGVLFGAFPHLEARLLPGMYPLVAVLLVALVLGNAAVQLRGRARTAAGRRRADALITLGGVGPAVVWGLLVGLLLRGLPLRADGSFRLGAAELLDPLVPLCGVAVALLFLAHGAVFLALRSTDGLAVRAGSAARSLLGWAAGAALLALGAGLLGPGRAVANPGTAVALALLVPVALLVARRLLGGGRPGRAFAATALAALLPVVLVGAGQYPYVLAAHRHGPGAPAGLTVGRAAADTGTLELLLAVGVLLVPVVLGYQAWSWWAFRGRVDPRVPGWFAPGPGAPGPRGGSRRPDGSERVSRSR
ncbi:cytochrome d ubiquinol oxidase subunit II [Streptomyces sp. NPDC094032]|uniref:cytochrome d ubiquinol oxidase subunit II n=1 Tax=Streptomyces sp. NPDC094032 TaxID=3155308 RepID=UPI00331DA785